MKEMKEMKETRRTFLKKMAYSAPLVVSLGVISAPQSSNASIFAGSGNASAVGIVENIEPQESQIPSEFD